MNRQEKRADWLKWFKLAVTQARDARLTGDIERARQLDETVEGYYKEAETNGYFGEGDLFEIESDIRNQ